MSQAARLISEKPDGAHGAAAGRSAAGARVIVVQPVVPTYRLGFFERVSARLGDQFSVYASPGYQGVITDSTARRSWERWIGPVRTLLPGVEWQSGASSIPVKRGDVVVVSGQPRCLSNLVLLFRARLAGARVIWWGQYWSATSRPWRARLRLALARRADALLFYTDAEAAAYSRQLPGAAAGAHALNNGIETAEIAARRKPYDAGHRGRRLLFIGRISEKACFHLLLHALAHPACAEVRLEVIGGGTREAEARAEARALGVEERVTWHGITTEEARIGQVANRCAAFVYPGAVGLSLIHAFAYGLPAIVHGDRARHYPEIAALREGENGVVFERGNVVALARTISSALDAPDRLERMSTEAVRTTLRSFNAEDMAERFVEAVASLQLAERGDATQANEEAGP